MPAKKSPDIQEESKPDRSKSKTVLIETANDVYELKRPAGKVGALHFRLLTKAMPQSNIVENGKALISPADQERLNEVFEQWTEKVLPEILVSHTYDDVPGEDQWFLFIAMFQTLKVSSELFRIVG